MRLRRTGVRGRGWLGGVRTQRNGLFNVRRFGRSCRRGLCFRLCSQFRDSLLQAIDGRPIVRNDLAGLAVVFQPIDPLLVSLDDVFQQRGRVPVLLLDLLFSLTCVLDLRVKLLPAQFQLGRRRRDRFLICAPYVISNGYDEHDEQSQREGESFHNA